MILIQTEDIKALHTFTIKGHGYATSKNDIGVLWFSQDYNGEQRDIWKVLCFFTMIEVKYTSRISAALRKHPKAENSL